MASKITIKRSLTAAAPAGLSFGEMAFVQGSGLTANQLYVGISGGSPVWVGAQIGTTGTWTDNAAKTSLATQFAIEERIGAKISATSVSSFNGVTGAVTGVASFNGLTGAVSGLTSGGPLGTPASGTLTSCTGLPVGTGISGLGTNVAAFLATPSSANFALALTDETGSSVVVFGTSPAITTSLTTPSTSFDLLNTTATTVNFAGGASSALNIGNVGGTATFAGSVIVNGDFTVQGNTTTLNTTTLNVEDFNITMGLTLTSAAQCTGAGIGIGVGTGITFAYDHSSLGWLSSVNMDLASGKVFKIANASVLSSSALGSGITGSSLTQVGTITSGTWNSSFAAGIIVNADINAAAGIVDTKLATIATANKVSNSATTAVSANTANTIVLRDGSGNFTAGTITAALTGNASTATTATNATNITVASETSDTTCFIAFVTASSGDLPTKVNSTLTYNAASGELSATLIDGGTF